MSNISALIDVFRMEEICAKVRAKIIVKLGDAINMELGGNYTEPLVYELVKFLDLENPILENEHYKRMFNDRI